MMKEIRKKDLIVGFVIAIIGSIVYEIFCVNFEVYSNFSIDRIGIVFAIILFIISHFIFGIKKVYDFIIEKRYILALIFLVMLTILGYTGSSIGSISSWILEPEANNTILGNYRFIRSDEYGVEALMATAQKNTGMNYTLEQARGVLTDIFVTTHAPVLDILTLCREYNLGYFILNLDMAFSFAWNFKIIALLLISFELFQIITNKNKYLSLIGSILISFSSFIAWWGAYDILIFGELMLIAIEYFMISDKTKYKLASTVILAYSVISYIFTMYPAWIISFGYIFLALAIWIIIKNAKNFQFKKIDVFCCLIFIGLVVIFLGRLYILSEATIQTMLNTTYPGQRNLSGGQGTKYLFSYVYSFLLPFTQTEDNMLYASMLSIFPIPLIMGLIYVYKKEKHSSFIMPLAIVLSIEVIWCVSGLPDILGKITLLKMVPVERCAISVALGCIYLYMYMIANIKETFISLKTISKISLVVLIVCFFADKPEIFEETKGQMYFFAGVATLSYFLMLNVFDKRYTKLVLALLVVWTLTSGLFVNPITKGTSVITETKLAKAIQTEVNTNIEALWITENMNMVVSNYLVANGAKTLNSTNFYPNKDLWNKLLEESVENYEEIWNRYAHIIIKLTDEETTINLLGEDKILINLNYNKLEELDIKYIVSYKEQEELENNEIMLNKIYENKVEKSINIENELVNSIYIYEIVN